MYLVLQEYTSNYAFIKNFIVTYESHQEVGTTQMAQQNRQDGVPVDQQTGMHVTRKQCYLHYNIFNM